MRITLAVSLAVLTIVACKRESPAPSTAAAAADGACADFACLIDAANACRPARFVEAMDMVAMGARVKAKVEWSIVSGDATSCTLTSSTRDATVELEAKARETMAKAGVSEAQIEEQQRTMAKSMNAGERDVRCVAPVATLAKLLTEQSTGAYNSKSWEACKTPGAGAAACQGDPPAAKIGCSVGPCDGGAWPITCGAKTCRLEGSAANGTFVGCGDSGSAMISTTP